MIALFVLKLSAGITLMWLLMPRREVTDGFFRIQMRLLLGTTVLTALLLSATTTWTPSSDPADRAFHVAGWLKMIQIGAACISYVGSIFWALGRRLPGNLCIYLLVLLCSAALFIHSLFVPGDAPWWLQLLSDAASALVLGAMLTAMLLGHWYLTTPTMSIRPLWWFDRTLLVSAGLRMLASGIALGRFGFSTPDTTQWLWLVMRLVGGILVPVVVSLLVWRILRYRNTQSATGVLFAGLILVFMGEMTAALLERDVQIPF